MSDIKKESIIYLSCAALCFLVNYGYSFFSHNVSSNYMTFMFVVPLVGFGLNFISKNKTYKNLLASSILTITLSFLLKGIIDIAGTTSNYFYVLLCIGVLLFITSLFFIKSKKV